MHGIEVALAILFALVVIRFVPKGSLPRGGLEITESTSDRVVIREGPNYIGAAVSIGLGMLILIIGIRAHVPSKFAALLFCGFLCGVMSCLAAYALVCSKISINRDAASLSVDRLFFGMVSCKRYPIEDIKEVFVWGSQMKGTGLMVRLVSGKERHLSMRTDYFELDGQAAVLNQFVASSRRMNKTSKHSHG